MSSVLFLLQVMGSPPPPSPARGRRAGGTGPAGPSPAPELAPLQEASAGKGDD